MSNVFLYGMIDAGSGLLCALPVFCLEKPVSPDAYWGEKK